MVMNESNENYLETILVLNHRLGNVRSVDIANEMNFKKPSVSVAIFVRTVILPSARKDTSI
jgi:DtxR family Mn-dependent transcriptional regulator